MTVAAAHDRRWGVDTCGHFKTEKVFIVMAEETPAADRRFSYEAAKLVLQTVDDLVTVSQRDASGVDVHIKTPILRGVSFCSMFLSKHPP